MIISDTKITDEKVTIRFYKWADPCMGYGDAGTYKYAELSPADFNVEEELNSDGTIWYYKYYLKQEVGERVIGNHWWMTVGYRLSSPTERDNEIAALTEKINHLSGN